MWGKGGDFSTVHSQHRKRGIREVKGTRGQHIRREVGKDVFGVVGWRVERWKAYQAIVHSQHRKGGIREVKGTRG